MRHKDLMVGRNPHFETKSSYLKSSKGVADGSQRYVVLVSSKIDIINFVAIHSA